MTFCQVFCLKLLSFQTKGKNNSSAVSIQFFSTTKVNRRKKENNQKNLFERFLKTDEDTVSSKVVESSSWEY